MAEQLLERTETTPDVTTSDSDASALTHIVNCPEDKESTQAWITEARVFGLPVTSLCGYSWVPSRDPIKHPICAVCVDIANAIIAEVNGG